MIASALPFLQVRQIVGYALVLGAIFGVFSLFSDGSSYTFRVDDLGKHSGSGAAPASLNTKIVALVFFGRRELVQVLDCYLKRNLKENGGLLDEVIFTINTDKADDLAYLEKLLQSTPRYRKFTGSEEGYLGQWSAANERETVYIKIDDDVVFFEDDAIANVVQPLLAHPEYFAVSANVVNNPALSWVHFHLGVFEPYWPETLAPSKTPHKSWRASELPSYNGPSNGPEGFAIDGTTRPPFPGHRWLPVRDQIPADPVKFPASTITYEAFGPGLRNWAAAAQLHYSFLQHIEAGEMWKYDFGMWDYHYQRLSINFFAVRGGDIMDAFPFPIADDEGFLTVDRPKAIGKHVVVAGNAMAVHFAFGPQRWAHEGHGMTETDLLDRYTAYAGEMVCPFPRRTRGRSVPVKGGR